MHVRFRVSPVEQLLHAPGDCALQTFLRDIGQVMGVPDDVQGQLRLVRRLGALELAANVHRSDETAPGRLVSEDSDGANLCDIQLAIIELLVDRMFSEPLWLRILECCAMPEILPALRLAKNSVQLLTVKAGERSKELMC